jgi:hypothetical protein
MAFVLPLIAGSIGSLSVFIAGYYINQPIKINTNTTNEKQVNPLRNLTLCKKINNELITFDKSQLKAVVLVDAESTCENKIMETLKQKIARRRLSIQPV